MEIKELGFETVCKIFPLLELEPYEGDVLKHLQGLHDQRTHGSWSGGGAGVDISAELDSVFYDGDAPNQETQEIIEEMKQAELDAGRSYGDNGLKIIAERQGFTGKPKTVATIADLQEIQKTEGGILVYRGITDFSANEKDITYTAEQALTDFREGEYYAGWGAFGNGTYTTVDVDEASSYASSMDDEGKMGNGKSMAMLIPKTAKMPTEAQVKSAMKAVTYEHLESTHRNNVARILAAQGFQAYNAGYLQDDKGAYFVVLDRSMLTVSEQAVEDQ
jgi:hypothetical protein